MKHIMLLFVLSFVSQKDLFSQKASEFYLDNRSATHKECISFFQQLDDQYPQAKLFTKGKTDIGKPLNLFVISANGDFNPESNHKKGKCVLLINNGIHPGEPDGIDASMKFAENLLSNASNKKMLEHLVICIIPVYNIDGSYNRGCCSRANQNGPVDYGFRGNAQNLDLNRDFIKCDAENTKSFIEIFQEWKPDVFIDNHVSNGADYQHLLTYIATQKDKLHPLLGNFFSKEMVPQINASLLLKRVNPVPYVDTKTNIPDDGLIGFLETPRFASGYAALFNTLGFVCETHMLKPFKDRVEATIRFMESVSEFSSANAAKIISLRKQAFTQSLTQNKFPLKWELDSTGYDVVPFSGYKAKYKPSEVSGLPRLYYDRNEPWQREIKFFNNYKPVMEVQKPTAYIIPQAWKRIVRLLELNGVKTDMIRRDTTINVVAYTIEDFKTTSNPYEGHYLHSNIKTIKKRIDVIFFEGDYLVYLNQDANRFLIETLEPHAPDSYFAWGFFDAILQQKEWFSDYVFEDKASQILKENPSLREELKQKQIIDSAFAKDAWAQLYFVYKSSAYFESTYRLYPVYRVE
jgi:hypothetical protein